MAVHPHPPPQSGPDQHTMLLCKKNYYKGFQIILIGKAFTITTIYVLVKKEFVEPLQGINMCLGVNQL